MSIKAGLVGLPNVGKSTLFNALTKSSAPAENYPFCTIDPHVAITEVNDERLNKLQTIFTSKKKIPATVTFVDIAGLVKGAASGEGLGNQFLSHIREVDLILHVLRCFEDNDITRTTGEIDPLTDYDIIITELALKDLESITHRLEKLPRLRRAVQSDAKALKNLELEEILLKEIATFLDQGKIKEAQQLLSSSKQETIPLLSTKNFLIIANVAEHELENDTYLSNPHYLNLLKKFGNGRVIAVSAKLEAELSRLNEAEKLEMLALLGIKQQGLDDIIQQTYKHLGLITFFTCGPQEAHAWPIPAGITVRQAAGEIHSDLERGFICAEVYNCADLFAVANTSLLKEQGKIRTEGQDYIVQDGDIILVRFNV